MLNENPFASWLTDKIKIEHSRQGHTLTGEAERTLTYQIERKSDLVVISVWGKKYMIKTNRGVKAENVDSWENSKLGLENYSKLRFKVGDKESKRIAYLIWRKHKKEGMPTKSSYQFSSTGKRTEYIEDVLNSPEFESKFNELYANQIIKEIETIFK